MTVRWLDGVSKVNTAETTLPLTKIWKNYKPASQSSTPEPPRALVGESLLAGLKITPTPHHTTVVWSMGTVCPPEMWQLLQPYC